MKSALFLSSFLAATLLLGACKSQRQVNPTFTVDRHLLVPLSAGVDSAVLASVGGYLAKDPRSWIVLVPDTSSADWLYLRRRLLQALSGISAGDTIGRRGVVSVSSVRFEDDAALIQLRIVRVSL
jgi:hypothetical protein